MSDNNEEPIEEVKEQESKEEENPEEIEEDDANEEESSDEELLGEFDKPIVVEGKRERKSISRFSVSEEKPENKPEEYDFSKGKGVKIGDIEGVRSRMEKLNTLHLKPLHRVIFNRDGKLHEVKKNIKSFCGFPFDKEDSQYKQKDDKLGKLKMLYLKQICEMFVLPVNGKHGEVKDRLLAFLMEPFDSGKGKIEAKAKKSKPKKKRKISKAVVTKESDKEDIDEDEDKDEDEEVKEEKSPRKEKVEKTPKKGESKSGDAKTTTPKKKEKETSKTPKKVDKEQKSPKKSASKGEKTKGEKAKEKQKKVTPVKIEKKDKGEAKKKKATPAKTPSKKEPKRKRDDTDYSDSDDEPIAKKLKPPMPTDKEIAKAVKDILEGADLETVTMKTVCKQVYDRFPSHDITDKKSFIKETVKKLIS